ncbi:MAG: MBL fold metallo-hydrolase [Defluviitaleaceae bacterium]|nr:MBL fold metallo-hydrolase [Defluviitaleaceae bacterium]
MKSPYMVFIGHGSLKFVTKSGKVIYVDPAFPGGDYSQPADMILITHFHGDHDREDIVTKAKGCFTFSSKDAINGGIYNVIERDGVKITPVEAYNKNHSREECVGYVLSFDGLNVYCSGDTSKTDDMVNKLPHMNIDYAFLPIDGFYNMDPKEASECAKIINARYVLPIHNDPKSMETGEFFETGLDDFDHSGKIVLKHGEMLELKE